MMTTITKLTKDLPKIAPSSKLDSRGHNIEQAALPPLPTLKQRSKTWILDASWRIVDKKNTLGKLPGSNNITEYRRLTRSLNISLKEDQKRQLATAGVLAEAKLNKGNIREVRSIICCWFVKAEDQLLLPSQEDLRKITINRITLY